MQVSLCLHISGLNIPIKYFISRVIKYNNFTDCKMVLANQDQNFANQDFKNSSLKNFDANS